MVFLFQEITWQFDMYNVTASYNIFKSVTEIYWYHWFLCVFFLIITYSLFQIYLQ